MLGIAAIAPNIIPWFLGPGYEKCVLLMQLFSPLVLLIGLSNVFGLQYLIPTKQDKKYTIGILSGAVTNLILNFVLIHYYWSLGAIIATLCAELMGGRIEAKSQIGKGTTFVVTLEHDALLANKIPAKAPSIRSEAHTDVLFKGQHFLLCEDNALNQEIVKALLADKGAQVDIAGNGKVGLEKFQASKEGYYSAILMDVHMPVMRSTSRKSTPAKIGRAHV